VAKPVGLAAVGEVLVDVVAGGAGDPTRRHRPVAIRGGGSALNAAVAAVGVGARATVVSRVGDDAAAALVRNSLERAGVAHVLAIDEERPTGCFVRVGETVVAEPGASASLAPADLPQLDADALLVSGYTLLGAAGDAGRAALTLAVAWPAADLASAALVRARGPATVHESLAGARVVFMNDDEAAALSGSDGVGAARSLAERYELVVVKRGGQGAVAATGGRVAEASASSPLAEPTVGAGDAFAGATLVALARGVDVDAALAAGVAAADAHIRELHARLGADGSTT